MEDRRITPSNQPFDKHIDPARLEEAVATLEKLPMSVEQAQAHALEQLVEQAMRDTNSENLSELDGLHKIANAYRAPCLIVRSDGRILATNGSADATIDVDPGQSINDLPFGLDAMAELARIHKSGVGGPFRLVRTSNEDNTLPFSIAILKTASQSKSLSVYLLFVLDMAWDSAMRLHIGTTFGLSNSEQDVLEMFISGQSLKEIAASRNRSLPTVRAQFYSVLAKMNVTSQADLLREVFKISSFANAIEGISKEIRLPNRREVTVLAPGGRTIDVLLAGDFTGVPVVELVTVNVRGHPGYMERLLKEQGIFDIWIAPPGFGATSPAPEGVDFYDCLTSDVIAVLDQLGIEKCVLSPFYLAFRSAVEIAVRRPDRVSRIFGFVPVVPRRFIQPAGANDTLFRRMETLALQSPIGLRSVLRLIARANVALGPHRFTRLLLRKEPDAVKAVMHPEVVYAIEDGFRATFANGVDLAVQAFRGAYEEWEDSLKKCTTPMSIVYSENGMFTANTAARRFAEAYSDRVQLVELPEMGSSFVIVYPKIYFEMMKQAAVGLIDTGAVISMLTQEREARKI